MLVGAVRSAHESLERQSGGVGEAQKRGGPGARARESAVLQVGAEGSEGPGLESLPFQLFGSHGGQIQHPLTERSGEGVDQLHLVQLLVAPKAGQNGALAAGVHAGNQCENFHDLAGLELLCTAESLDRVLSGRVDRPAVALGEWNGVRRDRNGLLEVGGGQVDARSVELGEVCCKEVELAATGPLVIEGVDVACLQQRDEFIHGGSGDGPIPGRLSHRSDPRRVSR